jgi:uncharacterized heparinase superfamily protein
LAEPVQILKLFHTVRHLKPIQVTTRLRRRVLRPRVDLRGAPPRREPSARLIEPARRAPSLLAENRFRFLNREESLSAAADWQGATWPRLWVYNLHYFDDLNAERAQQRSAWHRALIARWIEENRPGQGAGWEPYPTSLRIVNWIKWYLQGEEPTAAATASLAVQLRWLAENLEYHLLGNHLLANAKALVLGGLFFEGAEADNWHRLGKRVLDEQLAEQILPDGGHIERSPMYHSAILEDLLDLYNVAGVYLDQRAISAELMRCRSRWSEIVAAMGRWLRVMTHPDGQIAFFNDAAMGIVPEPAALEAYASRLGLARFEKPGLGIRHLVESGYIRLAQQEAVAILDVAPLGPDYLPGHAHADTLSFELSLFGRRVLVNSGTSTYEENEERLRQRGTAAHNTVVVNDQDSSEMWGAFRVARRARPWELHHREVKPGEWFVSCAHDGYRRLSWGIWHNRHWTLDHDGLDIRDMVSGTFRSAVARFHLHPDVEVIERPEQPSELWRFRLGEHTLTWSGLNATATLVEDQYHPEFGRSVPSHCLEVRWEGCEGLYRWWWQ